MIPGNERQFFREFVEEAVALAHGGRELQGYRLLDLGLAMAEAADTGENSWAEELVHRYRVALVRYTETFPVVRDSLPEAPAAEPEPPERYPLP